MTLPTTVPPMPRLLPRSTLALAVLAALAAPAFAAEDGHPHDQRDKARELDAVKVTATPLDTPLEQLARPAAVLAGLALDEQRAATLGDTVDGLAGVQNAPFGPGVGRPVIRGLDGARVQVLSNGLSSLDVSTVSADHAVSVEPFLADSIEVLKGPASLFFGSGAIGGAVNVVDNRIPRAPAERFISGRAEFRASSGNTEGASLFRLDGGSGGFAWHLSGLLRDTGDIDIPGFAYSADKRAEEIAEGEDPSEFERDELENSATNTTALAGGIAWFGERFFWGASLSSFATLYGVPGHDHGGHGHGHGHGHDDDDKVRIDLDQQRSEFKAGVNDLGPLRQVSLHGVRNEYRHVELKGAEPSTRFINDADELRLEAVQEPLWGWDGAIGLLHGQRDFATIGEKDFVPPTETREQGLFLVQQRAFGDFLVELGARHDQVDVDMVSGLVERSFDANSASLGLRWNASETWHFTANLDRAERAPTAEELYSEGPHAATSSYEIGDPFLETERADRIEFGAHLRTDRFEGRAAIYRTEFRDFIYSMDSGLEIDDLPVRLWVQDDATFTGWELEGRLLLAEAASGRWSVNGFVDDVRGELDAGGNLPRIAPTRVGLGLGWERDAWRGSVGVVNYFEQDRVAAGESPSDAFTLVDAQLSYHWDTRTFGWEAYLKGTNLTDAEARLHTSFLKDKVPLMGRSFTGGLRVFF